MAARKPKLVAVVGATGTGKSELAVSLARRFNGEIINADAMQLYAGLPIITNKISPAEQQGVPHHLLGCIGLDELPWTVARFVQSALATIAEIRARGRLPVLVGGTHYYTNSLLFHDQAVAGSGGGALNDKGADSAAKWPILAASNEELHAKLTEVDPVMARRWHPNDRRKIARSLEIYLQTGRRASDIYAEQRARDAGRSSPPTDPDADGLPAPTPTGLRSDTLILWIDAERSALVSRLDARVDRMLARGLLAEVRGLAAHAVSRDVDLTSGIWVSIGYKEVVPHLARLPADGPADAAALREAAEATKAATRRYAKSQVRWIRIKLLNALAEARGAGGGRRMYVFDGSDLARFDDEVLAKAGAVAETFLADGEMPAPEDVCAAAAELLVPKREDMRRGVGRWETRTCEACGVVLTNESDASGHERSRRHRRAVANLAGEGESLRRRRRGGEADGDALRGMDEGSGEEEARHHGGVQEVDGAMDLLER